MKALRIIFITLEYMDPIFSGNGAASRFQVQELLNQGHSVLVCCGDEYGEQTNPNIIDNERLDIISIPIQSRKTLGIDADYSGFCDGLKHNIQKIKDFNADLMINIDWHSSSFLQSERSNLSFPLIYIFFRVFGRAPNAFKQKEDFLKIKNFEYKLSKIADLNIQICKNNTQWVLKNYGVLSKTLYMPINPKFIKIADDLLENESSLSKNLVSTAEKYKNKTLITISRLSPEKKVHRLIILLKYLPCEIDLKIYGEPVKDEYFSYLLDLIKKNQLNERVNLKGWVQREEIIQDLIKSDAYVHPASYEPFGMSIMEAAYTKLPIFLDISKKIGAGELLDEKDACLRIPLDKPKEAANLLSSILYNPANLKRLGLDAQKIAKNLTVSHHIQKLISYASELFN
jgi:glycosyltransferase involved in cell wall biosynthesis